MRISVSGLEENQELMEDIAARLADLSPVLEVIAQDVRTAIDDSFAEQASPDGSPWAPLSRATVRRRRGTGAPTILVDTGRLRNSIATQYTQRSLSFGSNVVYGGAHQFGYAPRRLPARPYMPVTIDGGAFALMTTGRAGELWARARADVAHWVRTGEFAE